MLLGRSRRARAIYILSELLLSAVDSGSEIPRADLGVRARERALIQFRRGSRARRDAISRLDNGSEAAQTR